MSLCCDGSCHRVNPDGDLNSRFAFSFTVSADFSGSADPANAAPASAMLPIKFIRFI